MCVCVQAQSELTQTAEKLQGEEALRLQVSEEFQQVTWPSLDQ